MTKEEELAQLRADNSALRWQKNKNKNLLLIINNPNGSFGS